jgi:protein-S-isoprenylcysteine O-methyltransferase Ste14
VGLLGVAGGIGFILAMVGGLAAPLLQLLGVVSPLHILDHRWVNAAGFALAVCGLAATLYAQLDMGESWRVGIDTRETTALVRTGTFRRIRNPIFAAMLVFMLGETLLARNPVAIAVLAIFMVAVEVSVRTVEEPYLLAVHGDDYRDYTASVGRFVPGIGLTR